MGRSVGAADTFGSAGQSAPQGRHTRCLPCAAFRLAQGVCGFKSDASIPNGHDRSPSPERSRPPRHLRRITTGAYPPVRHAERLHPDNHDLGILSRRTRPNAPCLQLTMSPVGRVSSRPCLQLAMSGAANLKSTLGTPVITARRRARGPGSVFGRCRREGPTRPYSGPLLSGQLAPGPRARGRPTVSTRAGATSVEHRAPGAFWPRLGPRRSARTGRSVTRTAGARTTAGHGQGRSRGNGRAKSRNGQWTSTLARRSRRRNRSAMRPTVLAARALLPRQWRPWSEAGAWNTGAHGRKGLSGQRGSRNKGAQGPMRAASQGG